MEETRKTDLRMTPARCSGTLAAIAILSVRITSARELLHFWWCASQLLEHSISNLVNHFIIRIGLGRFW